MRAPTAQRKTMLSLASVGAVIGDRPAGELEPNARLLHVVRAVDAHLGNSSRCSVPRPTRTSPVAGTGSGRHGAGGSGGGAHTIQEWFDCTGRELGLKRILLTYVGPRGCGISRAADHAAPTRPSAVPLLPMTTTAEIIYVGGDIYAGARQTTAPPYVEVLPRVQALAVAGGRILTAGSNEQARASAGPGTTVVDLAGNFAMPGFNDAHLHLVSGGFERSMSA